MVNNKPKDSKIKKETTAGLIVYRPTKEGPKFLIMYHRGSYWNFPKGHIEHGETGLEAAVRETTEETGLLAKDLKIKRNFKVLERFQFRAPKGKVEKMVILYLAEAATSEIKISEEHDGYGWFLYRDSKRILANYKESLEALRRAYNAISRKPSRPSSQKQASRGKSPGRPRRS
ncbi:MAG: NUDIX domain-containing protein [Candidatus Colwellbacteria bacterium]